MIPYIIQLSGRTNKTMMKYYYNKCLIREDMSKGIVEDLSKKKTFIFKLKN